MTELPTYVQDFFDAHDFSPTGANPVTVADFLGEVQELVEQMDLL